ncbi:MAG: meso-butanediol dehydrogenase/(S,S)-butanediol dehydrogenase/diacetyl reductase [Paracoccaceae bacterium]|jgi:meso-butanediol dehydrogenase/(S,S)-butanediol dehydrogenase/diacetyl reductase
MKTALITGAARGIGLATAQNLLNDGWRVALLDRDEPELLAAAKGLDNVMTVTADVSDPAQVTRALSEVTAAFGNLDALVNNAGVADFGPIAETTYERWRTVMATNLDGPFLMTQAFADLLAQDGGGAVVNITSISGLRASTLRVAYGTSKAALAQLTLQQAVELGERGIRVNAVAPGPVDTKLALAVHTQDIRDAYHDAIPLNRYGKETEIAAAIAFLVSDAASFISGQVLAADGGFQATGIGLPSLRV